MAVIIGYHAIEEAIKAQRTTGELFIAKKNHRIELLIRIARENRFGIKHVHVRDLDRITCGADHRGAALSMHESGLGGVLTIQTAVAQMETAFPLIIVLDHITDPHNLGAILRSADQFGVDLVVLTTRQSAHRNATVDKVSSGASSYVKVCEVPNLMRSLLELKEYGYWVYGADRMGVPADNVTFSDRCVLVMGSEGAGLRPLVSDSCDEIIKIPTAGNVDSLNVSVAAGVLMYEIRRQKQFPYPTEKHA